MTDRHNLCPNPACKNDTTGWGGNSTFARTTSITGTPRSTGITWTGNGFSQPPTGVVAPGDVVTVSFYIKNNTGLTVTARTVFVAYTRSAGGDTFPESFTVTPGTTGSIVRGSFTCAAAPALATGIYLVIDQLNGTSGTGFDITAVLYEKVGALDTYFDGDSAGGSWDGADGNSASTLAGAFVQALPVATETSSGVAVGRVKSRALTVASATSTAQTFGRSKTRLLPAAAELDTAQTLGGLVIAGSGPRRIQSSPAGRRIQSSPRGRRVA